jgi:hypothetical protein
MPGHDDGEVLNDREAADKTGRLANIKIFLHSLDIAGLLLAPSKWLKHLAAFRIPIGFPLVQIVLTSTRCYSAWQLNPGGRSTYRRGESVQTTGAGAAYLHSKSPTTCENMRKVIRRSKLGLFNMR